MVVPANNAEIFKPRANKRSFIVRRRNQYYIHFHEIPSIINEIPSIKVRNETQHDAGVYLRFYGFFCSPTPAPGQFQGVADIRNRLPFRQDIAEQHARQRFNAGELLVAEQVEQ